MGLINGFEEDPKNLWHIKDIKRPDNKNKKALFNNERDFFIRDNKQSTR